MSTLDQLIALLSFQQSTKSCVAASATVLVYYWLTTLNQEVQYFWRRRWTIPATLFLLNRYTSIIFLLAQGYVLFAYHLSLSFCTIWLNVFPWWLLAQLFIPEIALLLRVLALYPRNLPARIFVISIYVLAAITTVVLKVLLVGDIHIIDTSQFGSLTGCLAISTVPLWPLVIPSIISQTIHFAMLMFKVCRAPRTESAAPILANLTQDGSIVYVTSLLATSASALTSIFPDQLLPVAMSGMHVAIISIGCSHLLLSVKALIYSDSDSEGGHYLIRGVPAALALSRIGRGQRNGATTFVDVITMDTGEDEAMAKVVTTRLGVWEDYFPADGQPGIEESVFADLEGVAAPGRQAIAYASRKKSLTGETIREEEEDKYMKEGSDDGGLDDSWSRQSTTVHGHDDYVPSAIPPVPSLPYLPRKT